MMLLPTNKRVHSLAVLLLALTLACNDKPPAVAEETPTPPPATAAGEHIWTTPDGISMPYSVAGKSDADVTVVFVHCWMGNRTFWNAQLPALAGLYRTVTLDLPGHGEATSNRTVWTVGAYGEDVAGLIRALDLSNVVLVGHSMGGPVALRAAALLPGKVLGIVAVDTLHDAEFKFEGEQMDNFMKAFETDFVGTCEQFVGQMIPEEGAEEVTAHIRQAGCVASRSAAGIALMRDFAAIDMPTWFREAGVPIRAINASAPNQTKIETNRKYADFEVVVMEEVGHYPHMTRPVEFNKLLLEAIAGLVNK